MVTSEALRVCLRNRREHCVVLSKLLSREKTRMYTELAMKKTSTAGQKKIGASLQSLTKDTLDNVIKSYYK